VARGPDIIVVASMIRIPFKGPGIQCILIKSFCCIPAYKIYA
jgi:hypothetical protein